MDTVFRSTRLVEKVDLIVSGAIGFERINHSMFGCRVHQGLRVDFVFKCLVKFILDICTVSWEEVTYIVNGLVLGSSALREALAWSICVL